MVFIREKTKKELVAVIKKTGQILLKEFKKGQQPKAVFKSRHDIVTKADLLAEKIIINTLKKLTPAWRILSEETGDNHKNNDFLWTLDPLDGTTNFYMGNPLFAVQLGLIYKNEPVWGIIYAPLLNEFYYAEKGKGAYLNNKKIKVSKKNMQKALLTYCHGSKKSDINLAIKIYQYFKTRQFDIRQLGAASLEFAWVAKGRTEAYISPGANLWDIAPGILLVKEAGGLVSDFKGLPWSIKSKNILATNQSVNKPIISGLKKT